MKLVRIQILFLFVLSAAAFSCQSSAQIKELNAKEFNSKLGEVKSKTLLDVRTPDEYKSGHISDAINLNIDSTGFADAIKTLPKDEPIFVYCLSGVRSAKAADELKAAGIKEIYLLKGGILAWQDAGLPFDKWPSKNTPHDVTISIDDYKKALQQNKTVLVDFNATWCQPCKMEAPILEEIAKEKGDSLLFMSIDVDKNMDLAKSEMIEALPTLMIFKEGKKSWQNIGYTEKNIIEEALNGGKTR
jgi:thioredoxin